MRSTQWHTASSHTHVKLFEREINKLCIPSSEEEGGKLTHTVKGKKECWITYTTYTTLYTYYSMYSTYTVYMHTVYRNPKYHISSMFSLAVNSLVHLSPVQQVHSGEIVTGSNRILPDHPCTVSFWLRPTKYHSAE